MPFEVEITIIKTTPGKSNVPEPNCFEFQNVSPLVIEADTPINTKTFGNDYINNHSIGIPPMGNLVDDLDLLKSLISKYTNNPSIAYLNVNSLRGIKFHQLESLKLQKLT